LAHDIRLVTTKAQEEYFRRACGTARFAWNWALAEWKRQYEGGEKPSGMALRALFNSIWREKFPWVGEVHRDCHSQPFANLQMAFDFFFKKTTGYPKFKKRGGHDSFYLANDQFRLDGKKVRIPRLGWIRTREALRFTGKVMGATVHRIADAWYISVQVDVGDYHRERTGNGVTGADLGLTTLVTLSTGEKIEGPKALAKAQKHLRRLHKSMDRKQKGSANRRKAIMRLSRAYARVTNIRSDALHKLTTRLCRENQAVGIEDLCVQGMLRNHHRSRSIRDASWGEFRRMLEYKSIIYGTDLRVADRWYPSSKTCSRCGAVKESLGLGERTFVCESCGLSLDRDLNAARNLGKLPAVSREVTPVERKALTKGRKSRRETSLDEAGTCAGERLRSSAG